MNAYVVMEGPHDVAFIARVLQVAFGFKQERNQDLLLPDMRKGLVPTRFPSNPQGDIGLPSDVPWFLQKGGNWVVLHAAIGDSQLIPRIRRSLELEVQFDAIGLILDADSKKSVAARFQVEKEALGDIGLPTPAAPGVIAPGPPRTCILVFPDNEHEGTLEDILLACGERSYPESLASAHRHVADCAERTRALPSKQAREFKAPAGPKKAAIGCVSNLLKPAKAIATSIQDNNWITPETLRLPILQPTITFLRNLLQLPMPEFLKENAGEPT